MRIFRYQLNVTDEQTIELPLSAQILHVAPDRDGDPRRIDMWAQVPEEAPMVDTVIRIFGTGHPIDNHTRQEYVGTVVTNYLVWHIFVEHDQMTKREK